MPPLATGEKAAPQRLTSTCLQGQKLGPEESEQETSVFQGPSSSLTSIYPWIY